ncbi:MAG: hypothetical protein AB1736_10850 [Chloroflexota bacterium]
MPTIRWPYRRQLVIADVLLLVAVAHAGLPQPLDSNAAPGVEWWAVGAIGYLVVVMHAIAWLARDRRDPRRRPGLRDRVRAGRDRLDVDPPHRPGRAGARGERPLLVVPHHEVSTGAPTARIWS